MSLSTFVAFWAVSLLFVITPGADWAYIISAGLRGRTVIPAVAGLLSGHLIATIIVAAGVGGIVAGAPVALSVMTIAGASYLVWLGINMLRHPSVPQAEAAQQTTSWRRWAINGACVSGLNPKVFLLFLALLPQFTEPTASWPIPMQIIALGLIHTLSCGVVYMLVGYGAESVLSTRPSVAQVVSRLSGATMIIIGMILLAEQAFI